MLVLLEAVGVLLVDEEDCCGFNERLRGASLSGVEVVNPPPDPNVGILRGMVPLLLCAGSLITSTLSLSRSSSILITDPRCLSCVIMITCNYL